VIARGLRVHIPGMSGRSVRSGTSRFAGCRFVAGGEVETRFLGVLGGVVLVGVSCARCLSGMSGRGVPLTRESIATGGTTV
jgi:hypothetical protein